MALPLGSSIDWISRLGICALETAWLKTSESIKQTNPREMVRFGFGVSIMRADIDAGGEPALGGNQRSSRWQPRDLTLWLTTLTNCGVRLSIKAPAIRE